MTMFCLLKGPRIMKKCNINRFLYKGKSGSSLLMVVILVAVLAVFATVVTTAVVSTNSVSAHSVNEQQAYFTARSAVHATVSYIKSHDIDKLSFIPQKGDSSTSDLKTADKMGDYLITIKKYSDDILIISAIAYYPHQGNGATGNYQCKYFISTKQTDESDNSNENNKLGPFTNILCIGGSSSLNWNHCDITGNILVNGPVTIDKNSVINGSVYAYGDVTLDNSALIKGSVYATGDLSMASSTRIDQDVYVGGKVNFINGNPSIGGSENESYSVKLPTINTNTPPVTIPSITNPVSYSGTNTISNDGVLGSDSLPPDSAITVDTSSNDVNLLINSDNTTLTNNIKVTGSHNLYIYLGDNVKNFNIENIDMRNANSTPKIFILGSSQTLSITKSNVNAVVYLPDGKLDISSQSMFSGSAFINDVTCGKGNKSNDNNIKFVFESPSLDGTPLSFLVNQTVSSESGN